MRYSAYSPGSVTLFFEIVREESRNKTGSRGVGVCINPGVITEVSDDGRGILLNGMEVEGEIQRWIAEKYGFRGRISTTASLPVSQGFGMSGAIALSTSLALAALKGKTYLEAAEIAHAAEVEHGTGLGDVASQYEGGFTFRKKAGIQPYGVVDRIHYPGKITLAVFGEKIETGKIIGSEEWGARIKKLGGEAMRKFEENPVFENALKIARDFSFSLGLMTDELEEFLRRCENATQALLGNSAIIFGECEVPEWIRTYEVTLGGRAIILR